MDLIWPFYIFMTALFSSLLMVPALRRWALETGIMDEPDERKVHQQATPRIGGVAVFMAFLFALLVYVDVSREVRGLLAGALIVFFTGLADDLCGLKARWKFLGQASGCLVTVLVGGLYVEQLGDLFGLGPIILPLWLAVPFTVFAVVGVSNALNLIDGLDGLAGGVSAIALGTFFLLALHDGNASAAALCAALLGGMFGFLKYNAFPARIFMGDTGSLTVGFLLAFLAVLLTQSPAASVKPVAPFIILGLPILDTVWVMSCRLLRRINPFAPDRGHIHHKLLDLGLQHRFTVIVIYGISLFWAVFVLMLHRLPETLLLAVFLVISVAHYLGLLYLVRRRPDLAPLECDASRGLRQSRLYLRLAEGCHLAVPLLRGLVLTYLAVACLYGGFHQADSAVIRIAQVLLLASLALLLITRDAGSPFLVALFYAATLVLVFRAEQLGSRTLPGGISLGEFTDLLSVVVGALVVLKLVFRRGGERFLTSPLDVLLLAMSVSVAFVSREMSMAYGLSGSIAKGMILFLAFKVMTVQERRSAGLVCGGVQAALIAVVVQGMW